MSQSKGYNIALVNAFFFFYNRKKCSSILSHIAFYQKQTAKLHSAPQQFYYEISSHFTLKEPSKIAADDTFFFTFIFRGK